MGWGGLGTRGSFRSLSIGALLAVPLIVAPIAGARPDEMGAASRPVPAARAIAEPAYISLLWGRSNWQVASGPGCTVHYAGARTLAQNAQDLAARGLIATAQVVVNRTADSGHTCFSNYTEQASWEDLRDLRDSYGWSVTSQGMNYADMTQMTTDAQRAGESVDTLPLLADQGFPRAWGAFAFANNKMDAAAQTFVARYFGFLRMYGTGTNDKATALTAPFLMNTWSLNGGRCNNPALACYSMAVASDRRMASLDAVKSVLNPAPGTWSVIQTYRLVDGTQGRIGDSYAWDCAAPDWRDRWTSQPEIYCRSSYLEAIDARDKSAVVTDPTSVAEAWKRSPADFIGWPHP